jgi:hypothetical protein
MCCLQSIIISSSERSGPKITSSIMCRRCANSTLLQPLYESDDTAALVWIWLYHHHLQICHQRHTNSTLPLVVVVRTQCHLRICAPFDCLCAMARFWEYERLRVWQDSQRESWFIIFFFPVFSIIFLSFVGLIQHLTIGQER